MKPTYAPTYSNYHNAVTTSTVTTTMRASFDNPVIVRSTGSPVKVPVRASFESQYGRSKMQGGTSG